MPSIPARLRAPPERAPGRRAGGVALVRLLALAVALALPAPLAAQEEAPDEWDAETEIGASVFFGNTDQTLVTSRTALSHADSTAEIAGEVSFNYGESSDELGNSTVSKRSWHVTTSVDYRPFARMNAFFSGALESSFEKKIDSRINAGLGAKLTAVRTNRTRVDFRAALLAETTDFAPSSSEADEDLTGRWSFRLNLRRTLGNERVTLNSETSYQPRAGEMDNFTVVSTSSLGVEVSKYVSLKLSFVDNFDSRAEERGALSDNDGHIFFGVLSSFD